MSRSSPDIKNVNTIREFLTFLELHVPLNNFAWELQLILFTNEMPNTFRLNNFYSSP